MHRPVAISETHRNYLRIVGAGLALVFLLLGILPFALTQSTPERASVTASVMPTAHLLVLRLPPDPETEPFDLLVRQMPEHAEHYHVVRITAGQALRDPAVFATADLSDAQFQALDRLRESWCYAPPIFFDFVNDNPSYNLGVRCGTTVRQIKIPPADLPSELADLVTRVE